MSSFLRRAGTDKSKVGRLLRSMYGCRDAGVNWEFAICQVMIAIGFVQGRSSPGSTVIWRSSSVCGYTETTLFLSVTSSISDGSLRNCKSSGLSRIEESLDPLNTMSVCKAFAADGITWEADPRHAELMRKSFGVTGRSVATLGVRDKLDDIEGDVPIDNEASDRYRAHTLRAQYLQ